MNFSSAYSRIEQLFKDQVEAGQQSKEIGNLAACGQFINKKDLNQKGLHGIAAAIYVLGQDSQSNELINKLCEFYEKIDQYFDSQKLEKDKANTIKQAEILYALSFIKAGVRDTNQLKKDIANKFLESIVNDQGWDYDLSNSKNAELISTAYSLKGLIKAGYFNKVTGVISYFRNQLKLLSKNNIDSPTRIAIGVLCLYVLVFYDEKYSDFESEYRSIFKKIKKSKYFSLIHSYEQNVEYHGNSEHHYIRIPWQLYYLALSAKLSDWSYLNRFAQKRITEINNEILNGGFKYEFSGEYLSSRTYSIIYETLKKIESNIPNTFLTKTSKCYFKIKPFLKYIMWVIVLGFMVFSIYKGFQNDFNLSDLTPEFVGYFVIILLTFIKKDK